MLYMVYKVEFDKDKPRSNDLEPIIIKITKSEKEARLIFMKKINQIESDNEEEEEEFQTELIGDNFEYNDSYYTWGLVGIKELKHD